jgi:hypothetical protein
MINKLIKKIRAPKSNMQVSKFNVALIMLFLVLNAILSVAGLYNGIYHFTATFLKNNYIATIAILLLNTLVLFLTFRDYLKKKPDWMFISVYLFVIVVTSFNIISINYTLDYFLKKAIFSSGDYIFTFMTMILAGLLVSKYDFAVTANFKEFYKTSMAHFYKNLGLFFSIALIVSILGFIDHTYVYAVGLLLIMVWVYPAKAILANLKK